MLQQEGSILLTSEIVQNNLTENSNNITSNVKEESSYELQPVFDTCQQHLSQIQKICNGPNDAINLNAVRRMSINIRNNQNEEDTDDEDCVITGVSGSVLLPLRSTMDELIKRENDPISGNIPCIDTVNLIQFLVLF